MTKATNRLVWVLGMLLSIGVWAADETGHSASDRDPHYTPAGFFDLHVCNWHDRPLFFMMIFSTERYDEVESVTVVDPRGRVVGDIALNRYRVIHRRGKPEKRAFITQVQVPEDAVDGWYTARIRLRDGTLVEGRDFVILDRLSRARPSRIPDGAELAAVPRELEWSPVPGAAHYQVFIRDLWGDGALLLPARLLDEPRVRLPEGVIQPGGVYSWQVHARDVNGHPLLGDFNHGSLSRVFTFSVAEP